MSCLKKLFKETPLCNTIFDLRDVLFSVRADQSLAIA